MEIYEYTDADLRDRHQLTAVTDPNGHRTEYRYYEESDLFPGVGDAFIVKDKEEYAKVVLEFPGAGGCHLVTATN